MGRAEVGRTAAGSVCCVSVYFPGEEKKSDKVHKVPARTSSYMNTENPTASFRSAHVNTHVNTC